MWNVLLLPFVKNSLLSDETDVCHIFLSQYLKAVKILVATEALENIPFCR